MSSELGGIIKITVWLATREPATWITGVEVLALGLILYAAPETPTRLAVGLPLLVHLGYRALTSLPMGAVPGRPENAKRARRHYDLRARVVVFLNEVRKAEDYAQRAKVAGWSRLDVEENLRSDRQRMLAAAAQVVKATGRGPGPEPEAGGPIVAAEPTVAELVRARLPSQSAFPNPY